MSKRLTELDPRWLGAGGEGIFDKDMKPVPARHGVGICFDCPCGCESPCAVKFSNPLDGGPPAVSPGEPTWDRTGETFESLTLKPSLQRMEACRWHGFITNGEVTP